MAKKLAGWMLGMLGVVVLLGTMAFLGVHVLLVVRERAIPFALTVVGGAPQEPKEWVEDTDQEPHSILSGFGKDGVEAVDMIAYIDGDHYLARTRGAFRRAAIVRKDHRGDTLFFLDEGLAQNARHFVKGVNAFLPLTDARIVKRANPRQQEQEGRHEVIGIFDLYGKEHAVRFALTFHK